MISLFDNANRSIQIGIEDFASTSGKITSADAYLTMTDGSEPPVGTCPECAQDGYVFQDGGCALGGFEMPDKDNCAICGSHLTLDDFEQGSGLCSYYRWIAEKGD